MKIFQCHYGKHINMFSVYPLPPLHTLSYDLVYPLSCILIFLNGPLPWLPDKELIGLSGPLAPIAMYLLLSILKKSWDEYDCRLSCTIHDIVLDPMYVSIYGNKPTIELN